LENSRKTLSVVGDVDDNNVESLLNKYLSNIPQSINADSLIPVPYPLTKTYVDYIQEDAQQAQILQGWQVASIDSEDYPKLMLLNIILGASGLSSRLFLELREKKGLAYTVRTSYEVHSKSSVFSIYIGTEPSNIQTSIDGFNEEINKIKNILVSEEELHNAKNNLIGKQQFVTETNSQQANLMSYYSIFGFPYSYQSELIEKIKKVTPEELMECANKYFTDDYVIAVIKP
jgi:predicted Zn-dependent peptidase